MTGILTRAAPSLMERARRPSMATCAWRMAPSSRSERRSRRDRASACSTPGTVSSLRVSLRRIPDAKQVIDADGLALMPGIIDSHTHFDAQITWDPALRPSPALGVTTAVIGNCGFTAAPVSDDPEVRMEMVKIFTFFEEVPIKPFLDRLPWDWRTWSEYRASLSRNARTSCNIAGYVGHIAIRLAVMGMDAWDRAATSDEVARMCDLLEDALKAGALGMSSNLLDDDSQGRPIPSKVADDAEWSALIGLLGRYRGSQLQVTGMTTKPMPSSSHPTVGC
jgi:N-acyl-D-amino-acid deacylase